MTMTMLDWSLYPNFTEAEMACKCGCGATDMNPIFISVTPQLSSWR